MIADAVRQHGVPAWTVNCVGRTESRIFSDYSIAHFEEQIRTNYLASVHLARAIVPHLLTRRRARLIFCSSLFGLFGLFGHAGFFPPMRLRNTR